MLEMTEQELHDQIWQKEIDMLEAFAQSADNFKDCPDKLWAVFSSLEKEWKDLFSCQIQPRLNILCKQQMRYLEAYNACLDNELFRSTIKRINVAETFIAPLMPFIVETNFNLNKTVAMWDDASKLAFSIIYKMNANFTPGGRHDASNLQIDLVRMNDRIGKELGGDWTRNRMRNLRELRKSFESFDQIQLFVCLTDEMLIEECDECLPMDCESVIARRLKRTAIVFKLPVECENDFMTMMRPFYLNVCTPPVEQNNNWLLDLVVMNNLCCKIKMSRKLCHDSEVARSWLRHFIQYDRDEGGAREWFHLLTCLMSLLARPTLPDDTYMDDVAIWEDFTERCTWFVDEFMEIYKNDVKKGIMRFFMGPKDLFSDLHASVLFLSILRLKGAISTEDHHEIIKLVTARQIAAGEFKRPGVQEDELYMGTNVVPYIVLTQSKHVCREVVSSPFFDAVSAENTPWFEVHSINLEIMEECALSLIRSGTQENLLRAALFTIEADHLIKTSDKSTIRRKATRKIKKLIEEDYLKDVCTEALRKLETRPRRSTSGVPTEKTPKKSKK